MEKGLLARREDNGGSFLFAEMMDSLGMIVEETGQSLMIE
jgi:hypothetical protein